MPKFFIETKQIKKGIINIEGTDVNHIANVLRKDVGDNVNICNKDTSENFLCKIKNIEKKQILCQIIEKTETKSEADIRITIFQGLPKADKMELIIQKCVELGVNEIIPVNMERCIVRLDNNSENKKVERWQKIAEVAAKQSGRDAITKISTIENVKKICNSLQKYDILLVAYEEEKENSLKYEIEKIKTLSNANLKIGVVIGPEGGISKREIEIFKQSGAKIVTLGNRILRTETVALVITSILQYELGDLC